MNPLPLLPHPATRPTPRFPKGGVAQFDVPSLLALAARPAAAKGAAGQPECPTSPDETPTPQ